jgi:hypothetical protein
MSTATVVKSAFLKLGLAQTLTTHHQQQLLSCGATFTCQHLELTKPIQERTETVPNNLLQLLITSVSGQM